MYLKVSSDDVPVDLVLGYIGLINIICLTPFVILFVRFLRTYSAVYFKAFTLMVFFIQAAFDVESMTSGLTWTVILVISLSNS